MLKKTRENITKEDLQSFFPSYFVLFFFSQASPGLGLPGIRKK